MVKAVEHRLRGFGVDVGPEDACKIKLLAAREVSGILAACNLQALPCEWNGIVAERTAGAFLQELRLFDPERLGDGVVQAGIREIREGDTHVAYAQNADGAPADSLIAEMRSCGKAEIEQRRRVIW